MILQLVQKKMRCEDIQSEYPSMKCNRVAIIITIIVADKKIVGKNLKGEPRY